MNEEDKVCDAQCGSDESSLESCLITYCSANLSNADCQTLGAAVGAL